MVSLAQGSRKTIQSFGAAIGSLFGQEDHDSSASSSSDVRPPKGNPNKPSPIPNVPRPNPRDQAKKAGAPDYKKVSWRRDAKGDSAMYMREGDTARFV